MTSKVQLTLALIKPCAFARPVVENDVRSILVRNKFYIIRSKIVKLDKESVSRFYEEHHKRFFYNRLINHMSSGPLSALVLAKDNAIKEWRSLMGPTKVLKTIHENPDSLRGLYGLSDSRNGLHGSDSEESAKRDIEFFYPEENYEKLLRDVVNSIKNNLLFYDDEKQMHYKKTIN